MENKKILKAIAGSKDTPIILGDVSLECYVLEDGTRVFSGSGLQKALKFPPSSGGSGLVNMLNTGELKDTITDEIRYKIENRKEFTRPGAGGKISKTYGYDVTLLIDICDLLIQGKIDGKLTDRQIEYAKVAEIIIRSVAKVGIIALVDEATGYQYDREKDALNLIFKAYISEELQKWQKMFPDSFYFEIFRLNGWDYTVRGIKKRPGVIGRWTRELIYNQLPKDVLDELISRTPKSASGNYTARFFQSLTPDIGHPKLTAQIYKVIGIMNISNNWAEFKSNFNKMVDRNKGQKELNFEEIENDILRNDHVLLPGDESTK